MEPRWEALGHWLQEERGGRHLGWRCVTCVGLGRGASPKGLAGGGWLATRGGGAAVVTVLEFRNGLDVSPGHRRRRRGAAELGSGLAPAEGAEPRGVQAVGEGGGERAGDCCRCCWRHGVKGPRGGGGRAVLREGRPRAESPVRAAGRARPRPHPLSHGQNAAFHQTDTSEGGCYTPPPR